jgi:hypothetical protein
MLKLTLQELESLESSYPGITKDVMVFENTDLPCCTKCQSSDTADVQIGIIGRTINICSSTTKFKLIPNQPRPGRYFCNSCNKFFTPKNMKEDMEDSSRKFPMLK